MKYYFDKITQYTAAKSEGRTVVHREEARNTAATPPQVNETGDAQEKETQGASLNRQAGLFEQKTMPAADGSSQARERPLESMTPRYT